MSDHLTMEDRKEAIRRSCATRRKLREQLGHHRFRRHYRRLLQTCQAFHHQTQQLDEECLSFVDATNVQAGLAGEEGETGTVLCVHLD